MQADIRELPAPPEAELIKRARMAARLGVDDAVAKVRAAGGQVSPAYWRDIERGHGGRRGKRVPTRASEGLLAQMAYAVGVTPAQLTGARRDDAAQVLEEIQRREPAQPPAGREPRHAAAPREPLAGILTPAEKLDAMGEYQDINAQLARLQEEGISPGEARGADLFPGDTARASSWEAARAVLAPLIRAGVNVLDWDDVAWAAAKGIRAGSQDGESRNHRRSGIRGA